MIEVISRVDIWLIYFLNDTLRNPVFNWIMPIFDYDEAWRIPLFVGWGLVMLFGGVRGRWIGLGALLVLALTDPLSARLFKPLFGRIRPCNVVPGLNVWWEGGWVVVADPAIQTLKGSLSFPSSHAANIGGQVFWWSWAYPKGKYWFIAIALLIGYSRIYDGVHYPFDVLGGYLLGWISFMIIWWATTRWGPESLRLARDKS